MLPAVVEAAAATTNKARAQVARCPRACECESTVVVAAVPPVEFGNAFEPATRGWVMPDRSAPGHIGDARHATAEKGAALLQVFSAGAASLVQRMLQWDGSSWEG